MTVTPTPTRYTSDTPEVSVPHPVTYGLAVDVRELRYFVAVAEELHFGRAAERLEIAQPPLSRAIAGLERRLGVTLFERTSRTVALTKAGAVLLSDARGIIGLITVAERRTRQAAQGRDGLIMAAKAGASDEFLGKLLHAYAAEPGSVPVDVVLCESQQQRRLLIEGQADVALLHLPFDSVIGLETENLAAEGQVAIVPKRHRLAGSVSVCTADVGDLPGLPIARWPQPDGTYPPGAGPEIRDLTQLFQLVALDRCTAIVPGSSCIGLRADLSTVPVTDAPVVTTVIGWLPDTRSQPLAALIRLATTI